MHWPCAADKETSLQPTTRPEPPKQELWGQSRAIPYEEVQKHAEGAATSSRDLPGLLPLQCRTQPEAPWTRGYIFGGDAPQTAPWWLCGFM